MAMTILKLVKPRIVFGRFLMRPMSSHKLTEKDVEEIQIPMPWGHISGKWWGDKKEPPVVAIHGWQDNANSFDKLIPLLNLPSVLAIDLPGQGTSSHFPKGVVYDFSDLLVTLHRIKTHFHWSSMPLLTHSLGSALGYIYAAVFPAEVKWLISTECIRCALSLRSYDCSNLCQAIDKFLRIENKTEQLNPSYKLSQLISMYMEGNIGSVCQPDKALSILNRVLLPSESINVPKESDAGDSDVFSVVGGVLAKAVQVDEEKDTEKHLESLKHALNRARENLKSFSLDESHEKYYTLKQDPSLKYLMFHIFDEEFLHKTAESIKCPVLSIRAKDGFLYGATKKLYEKNLDTLKTSSPYVEHHDVDGSHHVHLCEPENLAQIINNFIKKF